MSTPQHSSSSPLLLQYEHTSTQVPATQPVTSKLAKMAIGA